MEDQVTNTQEPIQEAPTQEAPGLSIQDLLQMLQIIQVVVQRGAVQANEMSRVGGLFDKLVAFLEANGAITRKAPAQENTDA